MVRELHDYLQSTHGWAYTTTKTMMDRMVSKGMPKRKEFHDIYIYRPMMVKVVLFSAIVFAFIQVLMLF
jgi:BlaI family penicillinase repressor